MRYGLWCVSRTLRIAADCTALRRNGILPSMPEPHGSNRRRWVPLLIIAMLFATGFGSLGVRALEMGREEAAARAIERLGGHADFEHLWWPPLPGWVWQRLPANFFCSVVRVDICRKTGIDPVLVQLASLGRLQSLDLSGCDVSDRGAECLESLGELTTLDLSGTQISDAGLEHIRGLSDLHDLAVGWTRVTDVGLRHLAGLHALEHLDLEKTHVTDAGLERLTGLSNLKFLEVQGTAVTSEGAKRFQLALPKCSVRRY